MIRNNIKMVTPSLTRLGSTVLLAGAVVACSDSKGVGPDRFTVDVAPLRLGGITDAYYTLRVWNGATPSALVWEQEHLQSTRYGDSKGSLTYVGSCDASLGVNLNRVDLVLERLVGDDGQDVPESEFSNPAPAGAPLSILTTCEENADTPVVFNLVLMRDAEQGFFDIGVEFDDIFCSAKFDCESAEGDDIELLHRPGGDRDTTLVLGFACTSGEGGTPTWLHMSDIAIECGTAPNITTYWVNPNQVGDGNAGGVDPVMFQTAVYRGEEQLPGIDKCFWNMAFGINEIPDTANCRIVASGTASDAAFGPTQTTPANTVYPYVSFEVPITGADGQVMCGKNPLDGIASNVTTRYTSFEGSRFAHSWQCGQTPLTERLSCSGAIDGIGATFTQSPDGIAVAFGNSTTSPDSPLYKLPEGLGLTLSNDCCMNPCCTSDAGPGD